MNRFCAPLAGLLALLLALAGCNSATPSATTSGGVTPTPTGAKPYIPVISKGFQHQFWQAVRVGAERAATEFNVSITFEGPANEAQVDRQIELLQTALDKRPAAICLAAIDSQALTPLLERAQAAGIPIIGFDSGVDSNIPVTTAATDNLAAASLAADKMAALLGGAGEVAVIAHDETSRSGIDRRDGFLNQIKAKYPQITVVAVQYGNGDHAKSAALATAIIQAHPNLKGLFGTNEGSSIGIINAMKTYTGKLVVVGFDSGQAQTDAIRSGVVAGAITQDPIDIGYRCVEAAVKALKGETLPKTINTSFHWYDQTNMDSATIKPLLY